MINQKIKTRQKMNAVARSLAADIQASVEIFSGYSVEVEHDERECRVIMTGTGLSPILTDSAMSYAMEVVNVYQNVYRSSLISSYFDAVVKEGYPSPRFVVCINYQKES